MTRSRSTRLPIIVGIAGLGWVAAHFLATALHLMPNSLIGLSADGAGSAYMYLLFSQRWSLFAPEPPLQNRTFHFQCADAEGQATPWLDAYKGLTEQHQSYRLTPSSYLRRVEGGAMRNVVTRGNEYLAPFLARAAQQPAGEEDEALVATVAALATSDLHTRAYQRQLAYRVAVHHCTQEGGAFSAVRVRAAWWDIPKFSQRNDTTTPIVHTQTLPWATRDDIDGMVEAARAELVSREQALEMIAQTRDASQTPSDPPPDPAPTDPAPTDPAPTDPAPTDPAPTDPAPREDTLHP